MKTINIIVKDITPSALSNVNGVQLQAVMDKYLSAGDAIVLSFQGIHVVSSSFLNSSFGNITDKYGFDILSKIRLVDYTSTIAASVKNYISDLKTLSAD
jgi:hypothetical protein